MFQRNAQAAIKLAALGIFVWLTNADFPGRIDLLLTQNRYIAVLIFVGFWTFAILCVALAAFQPAARWRVFWALVIGMTSLAGFGFLQVAGSELTVFDIASLWAARADTGRVLGAYTGEIFAGATITLFGMAAIAARPPRLGDHGARIIAKFRLAPVLPVVAIVGVIYLKSGGGTNALPQQFAPLAEVLVVAARNVTAAPAERKTVAISPARKALAKHVVLLVGESVRADYVSLVPGNPVTPYLAGRRDMIVDFGAAVSGSNCSHYANAIFRLGAGVNDVVGTVTTGPTIWQYAKKAGYRTVYIDASASNIRNTGSLQNFMTARERARIDEFVRIDGLPAAQLDSRLAATIAEILKRPEPQFIYANKNGAHFPYDESYPATERRFRPVMSAAGGDRLVRKKNSYANAVRWAIDGFFRRLLARTDLTDTALIYTSDHGQNLDPGKLPHCSTANPDPREALVPMFAMTGNEALRARFAANRSENVNRTSHFAIFPTVIELFGYAPGALGAAYGGSLFDRVETPTRFTSGDIFGWFSATPNWTALDTTRSWPGFPQAAPTTHVADTTQR